MLDSPGNHASCRSGYECTGRELTVRVRRIRQMIRERTRRLNREAMDQVKAAEQLQAELGVAAGDPRVEVQIASKIESLNLNGS